MAEFHCTHCDIDFDSDASNPRCPDCLRINGVLSRGQMDADKPPPRSIKKPLALLLVGLSLAGLAVGAGLLWYRTRVDLPDPGQVAVLDADQLRRTLVKRGVPADEIVDPFAADAAVTRLAADIAAGDAKQAAKQAAKILSKQLKHAKADLHGRGKRVVHNAAGLLSALGKATAHKPLPVTSFEAATLAVALLRAAGVSAVLCQLKRVDAPVKTPSVADGVGRYAAAVYGADGPGQKPAAVLDPIRALALPSWAGKGGDAAMAGPTSGLIPLDDGTAAAHLLALRGSLLAVSEPRRAYLLVEHALKAGSPSATLLLLRAGVLDLGGGHDDALDSVRRAVSVNGDAASLTALAGRLLARGNLAKARTEAAAALKKDPSYWPALLLMATVQSADKLDEAEKHLAAAERIAPDETAVLRVRGFWHLRSGDEPKARELFARVAARRPGGPVAVLLYRMLKRAGDDDKAAALRKRIVAAAADPNKTEALLDGELNTGGAPGAPSAGAPGPGVPAPTPPDDGSPVPELKLPDVTLTP